MTPPPRTSKNVTFRAPDVARHFQWLADRTRRQKSGSGRATGFTSAILRALTVSGVAVVLVACVCLAIVLFLEFGPPPG